MSKDKPNILFFFTDDQRFDTIAALGNEEVKTPNIDKLVESGTTFTQAHIPGGTVGAICMPSRAMLHTGRTLFHLENNGSTVPKEHVLMGEALQEAGYQTFGTGKWHNGTEAYARSFTAGGEIMFGGMGDHWNVQACDFDPTGTYKNARNKYIKEPFKDNAVETRLCDHITAGKHSSELFCETAGNWLKNYESEDPFFMYISFMAPHDPRSMPDEFLDMYNPEEIKLPENFKPEHPFDYGIRQVRDEVLAPYPRIEEEVKRHIAEYYGMISHLDHELGKVIDFLKEKGEYENTIIIFAGDNGLAVGQHGLLGKQSNYEHSIRVPLIFSGPGIPAGEKRDTYTYLMDIFPTICDLIDIEIPESVEGISLYPAFNDDDVSLRDTLYFVYADLVRGVKNEQYKLIEYHYQGLVEKQLFDLKNDHEEKINLYGKEEYDEITNKLKEELLRYRDQWDEMDHSIGKNYWD